MTLIASSVPSLLGGVSQQPTSVRFPNQCAVSDNALASVVEGLTKRPHTEHIAKIIDGTLGLAKVHIIDRGVGERYAVIMRDKALNVFDLTTGVELGVYDSSGNLADAADLAYLASADPVSDFNAVTVADYTFIANGSKTVELNTQTNPDAQEAAFLFVQQSAYEVDYKVRLQSSADAAPELVSLSTWDGDNTSGNLKEVMRISSIVTAVGTWSGSVLGTTWSLSYSTGPFEIQLASNISAVQGVTAEYHNGAVDITCDHPGLDQRFTIDAAPTGGSWSLGTIVDDTITEEQSLKTTDLATRLATEISALTNWTASSIGSTVKIEPASGETIDLLEVEDSVGSTYLKRVWQSVSSISDLPLNCQDGHVIRINGDQSSNQDDYFLKFAAEVTGSFGPGVWEEAPEPGIEQGLDTLTMPLVLVRKIATDTFPSALNEGDPYFAAGTNPESYASFEWTDRVAGSAETNPSPSFVGKQIKGIFFHGNRLGFLADQNVIMSETGLYGNFWRTTVLTLPDSEPVDLGVGHTRVSLLNHAIPFNERLYLFSDRTQFVIPQSVITPSTATIVTAAEYENSADVGGVLVGSSIFFPFGTDGFGRILEMFPNSTDGTQVNIIDSTQHIPQYMPGAISALTGSTTESILAATSTTDTNAIYVLSFLQQGRERLQSAWQRFVLGAGSEIIGAGFIEEVLYLTVKRTEGLFLESITFGSGQSDTDSTYRIALDRRITEADLTSVAYSADDHETTLTLPYDLDNSAEYQVVTRTLNGKNDPFNLLGGTEAFEGGGWVSSTLNPGGGADISISRNTHTAPDGELTADTLTGLGDSTHDLSQTVGGGANPIAPVVGDSYTWSIFVKKDQVEDTMHFVLDLYPASVSPWEQIAFALDTSTGLVTYDSSVSQGPLGAYSASSITSSLQDGDWWRVSATLTYYAPSGANVVDRARISLRPTSGTAIRSITVWGAQLVKNDLAEPYTRVGGVVVPQESKTTNTIVLRGDWTTTPLWLGEQYAMKYEFSEINLKENSGRQGRKGIVATAEYYLRHATVLFDETGYFKLSVQPKYRAATVQQFTSNVLGGDIGLRSGRERFSAIGNAKDLTISIENDSPLPSNILGIEWTARYNSKSARYAI